jgi:hypothetical protein
MLSLDHLVQLNQTKTLALWSLAVAGLGQTRRPGLVEL